MIDSLLPARAQRRGATAALVLTPALGAAPGAAPAEPTHGEGVVRDAAGTPVAKATVSLEAGGDSAEAVSDAEGRFAVDWAGPRLVTITIEAAGFPRTRRALYVGDGPLDLVATPATFQDRVTVTAAR